jgi:hypothetical protein
MAIDFEKVFGVGIASTLPTQAEIETAEKLKEEKLKEEAALPPSFQLNFPSSFRDEQYRHKWRYDRKWWQNNPNGNPAEDLKRRRESHNRWRQDLIRNRADVLFGSVRARDGFHPCGSLCKDLWCGCKSNNRRPFRLDPSGFIRHARRVRPEKPEATVSAFASWLYSLYSNAYGDEEDRERGKALEPAIFELRKMAQSSISNGYLRSIGSEWRLVHNGLHLPGQDCVPWFSIDHLPVNGEALRASPDLIYRHPRLNEVMIVEIKHSYMEIPSNLWPNVWGQLWCYSQLDIARSADRVTVVGEVWGETTEWYGRRGNRESVKTLHLRASARRDPREHAYDRFFRTLFEVYCGHKGLREPRKT